MQKTTNYFRFRVKFYNFAHQIQQIKNMDIKEIINKRYAMPDASLDKLQRCLTEVSYPKGFRVLERGKVEKNIFSSRKALSAHILQWTERKLPFGLAKRERLLSP